MGLFKYGAAALVLALLPSQVLAQAGGLSCMAAQYDAGELGEFTRLGPDARFGDGEDTTAADQMSEIALQAVLECAGSEAWSQDQTMQAAYYELGRINEQAYRRSGAFTADQLARFDQMLRQGGRAALWEAVERSLLASMGGPEVRATSADEFALGSFAIGVGEGDAEAVGESVGVLLGFMALQRVGAREFIALQEAK